jgi:hypothetical protein
MSLAEYKKEIKESPKHPLIYSLIYPFFFYQFLGFTLGRMYLASYNSVNCFFSSFNSSTDILYSLFEMGAVPGKRSIMNSTSLSGGIPGYSSGKTSGKSLTTRMLLPTSFPSTRNMAGLVEAVIVISTSNLSPLELVSSMVPLSQCITALAFLN